MLVFNLFSLILTQPRTLVYRIMLLTVRDSFLLNNTNLDNSHRFGSTLVECWFCQVDNTYFSQLLYCTCFPYHIKKCQFSIKMNISWQDSLSSWEASHKLAGLGRYSVSEKKNPEICEWTQKVDTSWMYNDFPRIQQSAQDEITVGTSISKSSAGWKHSSSLLPTIGYCRQPCLLSQADIICVLQLKFWNWSVLSFIWIQS